MRLILVAAQSWKSWRMSPLCVHGNLRLSDGEQALLAALEAFG